METVKRIHAQNEASGLLLPETLGFGKSILRIYSPLPLAARATHQFVGDAQEYISSKLTGNQMLHGKNIDCIDN